VHGGWYSEKRESIAQRRRSRENLEIYFARRDTKVDSVPVFGLKVDSVPIFKVDSVPVFGLGNGAFLSFWWEVEEEEVALFSGLLSGRPATGSRPLVEGLGFRV